MASGVPWKILAPQEVIGFQIFPLHTAKYYFDASVLIGMLKCARGGLYDGDDGGDATAIVRRLAEVEFDRRRYHLGSISHGI